VVLPGAAIAGWMYEPLRERLAQQFRLVTFEYRGIGRSTNDLWAPGPARLAEDVLLLLDHLGAAKAHAVGFSLGTFVMAELLHRAPERLGRCAIGCMPVVRRVWSPPEEVGDGIIPLDMPEAMTWNQLTHVVMPLFFSAWYKEAQPEAYEAAVQRASQQTSREMLAAMGQLGGVLSYDNHRLKAYDALPRDRKLFLVGEKDAMTQPANLRQHPLTAKAEVVVFRRSGHVFFYEQPDATAAVLAHFWKHGSRPAEVQVPAGMPAPAPLEALA
jgi:pimeloyl-ACP methyl ester carboxylesterase